ncbi:hypothetical protein FNF27_06931 [Cafeteria roenbergensis]|uniref:PITH domain-containing protein n=1 Tax=Cafeteria roenbergensis TaxID=33653 RepID=A0A5A8CDQ3_CAFRO|nr:hypothetical protein FNF29_04793 [Cafeteria roenbergensis]KAA0157365.1 hypothetical protein FNF28_06539 [Cafeteria roenbergensis]KAA0164852.1 hypothetical protein FNF31_02175 [Cafeteria roenbergensis]KAA0169506.1 hypothetical protein FNF27_06931 [Cafeteria roenbergensis]CAE7694190.1 unnamed protein product [Symbiodinium sp. KB8]|eukprot:KAA0151102.1 hypothetical protein FNF29_04793 [Cafeteria roenbergensis]
MAAGGGCAAEADLDHVLATADAGGDSLFGSIDREKVFAYNEAKAGAAVRALKPWARRREAVPFVLSDDDDPELIIHIPFTCNVQLRSIAVVGADGEDGSAPASVRIFANREDVDFDLGHDLEPCQEITDLVCSATGDADHALRPDKFRSCWAVTLFFTDSRAGGATRISYIGFKGRRISPKRQAVNAIYELVGAPEASSGALEVPKFVS